MQTYTKLHIMLIIMCQNSHSEEKKHRMCSRTHAMEKNVEIVFDIFFRTIRSVQLVSLWANTEVISFEKRANSVTNDTHTQRVVTIMWPGFAVKTNNQKTELLIFVHSQFVCIYFYFECFFPPPSTICNGVCLICVFFRREFENKRKQLRRLIM